MLVTHCTTFKAVNGFLSRGMCYRRRVVKRNVSPVIRDDDKVVDRPYSLPPGIFRPKQSLGQNFLSDQNTIVKICDRFKEAIKDDPNGDSKIIEIGPGAGALTRVLFPRYPNMTAIEIDPRAVKFLNEKLPGLKIFHMDALQANWPQLAAERGGRLNVVGNLPYNIVSQVLFTMADACTSINKATLTMQLEVADRLVAKPRTKQYGIPSVVFQLYCRVEKAFHLAPTVFYPKPDVDSAVAVLDFNIQHPGLKTIDPANLKKVLSAAFQQRRKMLRQSLKGLMEQDQLTLNEEKWGTKRPEELRPVQFIELVLDLYGPKAATTNKADALSEPGLTETVIKKVWRQDRVVKAP